MVQTANYPFRAVKHWTCGLCGTIVIEELAIGCLVIYEEEPW